MLKTLALTLFCVFWHLPSQAQILVYTGTFDPPHDGHKEILLQGIEQVNPRMAFVNPGPTGHKPEARPLELRMEMTEDFSMRVPGVSYPPAEYLFDLDATVDSRRGSPRGDEPMGV